MHKAFKAKWSDDHWLLVTHHLDIRFSFFFFFALFTSIPLEIIEALVWSHVAPTWVHTPPLNWFGHPIKVVHVLFSSVAIGIKYMMLLLK